MPIPRIVSRILAVDELPAAVVNRLAVHLHADWLRPLYARPDLDSVAWHALWAAAADDPESHGHRRQLASTIPAAAYTTVIETGDADQIFAIAEVAPLPVPDNFIDAVAEAAAADKDPSRARFAAEHLAEHPQVLGRSGEHLYRTVAASLDNLDLYRSASLSAWAIAATDFVSDDELVAVLAAQPGAAPSGEQVLALIPRYRPELAARVLTGTGEGISHSDICRIGYGPISDEVADEVIANAGVAATAVAANLWVDPSIRLRAAEHLKRTALTEPSIRDLDGAAKWVIDHRQAAASAMAITFALIAEAAVAANDTALASTAARKVGKYHLGPALNGLVRDLVAPATTVDDTTWTELVDLDEVEEVAHDAVNALIDDNETDMLVLYLWSKLGTDPMKWELALHLVENDPSQTPSELVDALDAFD